MTPSHIHAERVQMTIHTYLVERFPDIGPEVLGTALAYELAAQIAAAADYEHECALACVELIADVMREQVMTFPEGMPHP